MKGRQIILDTETTGLEVSQGHRIIEIGCVELVSRRLTGRQFHRYLNPERDIDEAATAVHGITRAQLAREPRFADIAEEFVAFVEGAELVIHNAAFDVAFLDAELRRLGVKVFHGDLRAASDLEPLPAVDWVIDAAANPSVLAGVDGRTSSRQLVEHNLGGTVNLLEYCKQHRAGFILLSTSRVYSIPALAELPMEVRHHAFHPAAGAAARGLAPGGLTEEFSTGAPVSLYGATKLASEVLALEHGETFGLPVFVNRCGVLAGAGQFGRPDEQAGARAEQQDAVPMPKSSRMVERGQALRHGSRDLIAELLEADHQPLRGDIQPATHEFDGLTACLMRHDPVRHGGLHATL